MTQRTTNQSPCNPDRFVERVMNIDNCERAFCRCCGLRIAVPRGFWSNPDPSYLERQRLFA